MEVLKVRGLDWWHGDFPGWRAALSGAWRGALTPIGPYLAMMVVVQVVELARGAEPASPVAVFVSLGGAALSSAVACAVLGAPVLAFLGRLGAAGIAPFALYGALGGIAPVVFAEESNALNDPGFLVFMAVHGALTATAMLWWARRAKARAGAPVTS